MTLVAALVIVGAAACGGGASAPAAVSSAPAAAADDIGAPEQTSIKVVFDRPAYSAEEVALAASDFGRLKAEGLTAEVFDAADTRAALLSGSADIASVVAGTAYQAAKENTGLVIFAGLTCRQNYTLAVAPGINKVTDLNGKDILLAATAGDPQLNSRKATLKEAGWDLDQATPNYVNIPGGSTAWAKLFTAGRLFLMPSFPAVRESLLGYGAKFVADKLQPWPNSVYVAKKSWLAANPNTAARYLRAMMKTIPDFQAAETDAAMKAKLIAVGRNHGFDVTPEEKDPAPNALSQEALCANLYLDAKAMDLLYSVQKLPPVPFSQVGDITQLLRAQKSLGLTNAEPPLYPWPPKVK